MDSSKTDRHYHFQSVELVLFLNVYSKIKKRKRKLGTFHTWVYAVGGSVPCSRVSPLSYKSDSLTIRPRLLHRLLSLQELTHGSKIDTPDFLQYIALPLVYISIYLVFIILGSQTQNGK